MTHKQQLFNAVDFFNLTDAQVAHFRANIGIDTVLASADVARNGSNAHDETIWRWAEDGITRLFVEAICSTADANQSLAVRDVQIDEARSLAGNLLSFLKDEDG